MGRRCLVVRALRAGVLISHSRRSAFDSPTALTFARARRVNIDWLQLIPAIVLLWLPRQALRAGGRVFEFQRRRRRRFIDTNPAKTRDPHDQSVSLRTEIGKMRNHIDFVRAGLGAVMLMGGVPGIDAAWQSAPAADPETVRWVVYGRIAVLAVAVLIQLFRFEHRPILFAPIFYLTGLSIGLSGFHAGGFALLLVWIINLVLPNAAAFLSVHALLIVVFGTLFLGLQNRLVLVNAGLVFLPVLVSLLGRRPLVQLSKKQKVAGS